MEISLEFKRGLVSSSFRWSLTVQTFGYHFKQWGKQLETSFLPKELSTRINHENSLVPNGLLTCRFNFLLGWLHLSFLLPIFQDSAKGYAYDFVMVRCCVNTEGLQ